MKVYATDTVTLKGNKTQFEFAEARAIGSVDCLAMLINDRELIFQHFSRQYSANKTCLIRNCTFNSIQCCSTVLVFVTTKSIASGMTHKIKK